MRVNRVGVRHHRELAERKANLGCCETKFLAPVRKNLHRAETSVRLIPATPTKQVRSKYPDGWNKSHPTGENKSKHLFPPVRPVKNKFAD